MRRQATDDRWRWMPEAIAAAHRPDRQDRLEGVEQPCAGRRGAAMVREARDRHRGRCDPRDNAVLDLLADVAGQQHTDVAETDPQHDGVVVADPPPLPVRTLWMHDVHPHGLVREALASRNHTLAGSRGRRGGMHFRLSIVSSDRNASEDLPRRQSPDHRRHASRVIGMRVRHHHAIETPMTERPEGW
jgi:hypothetical protein